MNWKAADLSGVQNYRFGWDQNPLGTPAEVVTGNYREIPPPGSGTWWAHIQAQDNAGNWGMIEHLPIMLP